MHCVYVLQSEVDELLYVGSTENVVQRLRKHNAGDVPSTSERRPWRLLFLEGYLHQEDALRRERYFKGKNQFGFFRTGTTTSASADLAHHTAPPTQLLALIVE